MLLLQQLPSLVWELQPDLVRPHLLLGSSDLGDVRDGSDEWDVVESQEAAVPKPDDHDDVLHQWESSHHVQLRPHAPSSFNRGAGAAGERTVLPT